MNQLLTRTLLPLFAAISVLFAMTAAPAGATALAPPSPNLYDEAGVGLGEFTAVCDYTGIRATIDPIVAPGSTTFAHSHDFFGNTGVSADSDPDSLRANPDTTCTPAADASSYWIPSLLQDGEPLDAESVTAYYFVKRPMNPAQLQDMPAGMKMIAGSARATSPQPLDRIAWTCLGASEMDQNIPDCRGRTLQLAVFFPQCWDGINLDSADHVSHIAYTEPVNGCPDSHPYLIPQLELQFRWQPAAGAKLEVSSDAMMGQTEGVTAHADFLNGWDGAALKERTDNCLRWPVVCLTNGEDRRISQSPMPPDLQQPPTATPPPLPDNQPTPAPPPEPTQVPTPDPARSAFDRIQAESFDSQQGVQTESTRDAGGGENVGWLANGDWTRYDQVDFGDGAEGLTARVASAATTNGRLEIRLDDPVSAAVASLTMGNTGGWQAWQTVEVALSETVSGVHDVYLSVANDPAWQDVGNINWLQFLAAQTPLHGDFYGEGRVDDRNFWGSQRGIGFSVSSQGSYSGQQRLERALQQVSELGYTTIRTWAAGEYTARILQTIEDLELELVVQVGVWVSADTGSRDLLDRALATIEGHEDRVLSLSLGNEQLADWNSSDMNPGQLAGQIDYVRQHSTVPLTYNFSDATLRSGSSFWSRGGAELLPQLDYVNVHDYGATFINNNRWNPGYTPDDQLSIIKSDSDWLAGLLDSLGMEDVPLVLGETGWQSSGYAAEVTNSVKAADYAEGVARYLYSDSTRFDSMFYFNLSDEAWKGGDDHWGLFGEGGSESLGTAKHDLGELRKIHAG